MHKKIYSAAILFLSLVACSTDEPNPECASKDLQQVGSFETFASGQFDGLMPIESLLISADFGIGTLDSLDGEMLVHDRRVYQFRSDGSVVSAPENVRTPFAMMCKFISDTTFSCTDADLYATIDRIASDPQQILAIQVQGDFHSVTTASFPKQHKPYPSMQEVLSNQQVSFSIGECNGLAVGFRIPAYCAGMNQEGYHMHFISSDGTKGGHITSLSPGTVSVSIRKLQAIQMIL